MNLEIEQLRQLTPYNIAVMEYKGLLQSVTSLYPGRGEEPAWIMGIQAILGSIWWMIIMLVYLKNHTDDNDLRLIRGDVVGFPIMWIWERMVEKNGTNIWISWAIAFGIVQYFLVSVIELFSFVIYQTGNMGPALWYFRTIGYWGSFTYVIPFVFSIIQVGIQGYDAFPGSWALFLMVGFGVHWILFGALHIIYVPSFVLNVESQVPTNCVCSIPEIVELPVFSTSDVKAAWEAALTEREDLCAKQLEECNARLAGASAGTKAEEEEGAAALLDDEEDEDFEL